MFKIIRTLPVYILCYCSSSYAMERWDSAYTSVYTVTGGGGIASPGRTQTVRFSRQVNLPVAEANSILTQNFTNTYDAQKKTQGFGTGEVFLGLQWVLNQCFVNQLGFAFGGASAVDLQGTLIIDSIPSGSRYTYHTKHGKVVIRDKLLYSTGYSIQPYLTGSYGAAFNKTDGYMTTPRVDINFAAPTFKNNTKSFSYTYSAGFGVQQNINGNWNISLGYEFADWGQSRFGAGVFGVQELAEVNGVVTVLAEQGIYKGPSLNHVYTHNMLLSVSYLY